MKQESLRVSRTELSDWKVLRTIRLAALKESPEAFGSRHDDEEKLSEVEWKRRASGKTGFSMYLGYVHDRPCGLIGCTRLFADAQDNDNNSGRSILRIVSMWVAPEARMSGLGRMLVEEILNHAYRNGYSSVVLEVTANNDPVRAFYRRCGFQVLETGTADYLSEPDNIVMARKT